MLDAMSSQLALLPCAKPQRVHEDCNVMFCRCQPYKLQNVHEKNEKLFKGEMSNKEKEREGGPKVVGRSALVRALNETLTLGSLDRSSLIFSLN